MLFSRAGLGALVAFSLAACNGSSNGSDGGPGASVAQYYNLSPNQCFAYGITTSSSPTIGLTTIPAADGVELHFSRLGNDFLIEHLSFDGGTVADLENRSVVSGSSKRTWAYSAPLFYLQSNLSTGSAALISSSPYAFELDQNQLTHGYQQAVVSVVKEEPNWPYGSSDAGVDTFELQFSFSDVDSDGGPLMDAGQTNLNRWVSPGVGFVGLYLEESPGSGSFVKYYLLGPPTPLDGGCGL